jgi:AcrR family transcriptional regulator
VLDARGIIETLSLKLGIVLLALGVLHLINVRVFTALRNRARRELPPEAATARAAGARSLAPHPALTVPGADRVGPGSTAATVRAVPSSPAPRSARGEQTRTAIVTAALELFRERGYEGTRMRAVTGAAGVSLGDAYNYVPSKEHLILAFYDRLQEEHAAAATAVLARKTGFAQRLAGVEEASAPSASFSAPRRPAAMTSPRLPARGASPRPRDRRERLLLRTSRERDRVCAPGGRQLPHSLPRPARRHPLPTRSRVRRNGDPRASERAREGGLRGHCPPGVRRTAHPLLPLAEGGGRDEPGGLLADQDRWTSWPTACLSIRSR